MENKWKQWISGFGKKGKLPAKQQLLILLLAGILLVVVVSPVPDQKDPEIGTGAGQEETETEGGEATEQQYERLLEKRVEDTLECVEGVGKVKVMITLKSSEEKVVEKDSQREENEITFFPRTCASGKTLFRPQVCEQGECAQRPASLL